MPPELHTPFRIIHITLGFAGFVLGAVAIFLPKFTRRAVWHRRVGRAYAVAMLVMSAAALPPAIANGDIFLFVIGVLTLGWVAVGWIAIRRARSAGAGSRGPLDLRRLRTHYTLMGSSYIAAWTAFLVNVQPLGETGPIMVVYAIAPTVVGSYLIARTSLRYTRPAPE